MIKRDLKLICKKIISVQCNGQILDLYGNILNYEMIIPEKSNSNREID
jgi:hypothetical protein